MSGKRWRLSVQLALFKDAAALGGTPAKHQTIDADPSKLLTRLVRKNKTETATQVPSANAGPHQYLLPQVEENVSFWAISSIKNQTSFREKSVQYEGIYYMGKVLAKP